MDVLVCWWCDTCRCTNCKWASPYAFNRMHMGGGGWCRCFHAASSAWYSPLMEINNRHYLALSFSFSLWSPPFFFLPSFDKRSVSHHVWTEMKGNEKKREIIPFISWTGFVFKAKPPLARPGFFFILFCFLSFTFSFSCCCQRSLQLEIYVYIFYIWKKCTNNGLDT